MRDLRVLRRSALRGAARSSTRCRRPPTPVRLRGVAIPLLGAMPFLAAASPLHAQVGATLRGVVRSGITGDAISGAVVQIVGTRAMTTTGDDGRYAILTVPMGESVVRVTHGDHVGLVDRIFVDQAAVIRHDFEIMPPAFVLEEMVARAMQRVEVPDASIDGSELAGGRGVREVLSGVTGVTLFRTSGAVGAGYYLRIRGAKSFHFNQHPVGLRRRRQGAGAGHGGRAGRPRTHRPGNDRQDRGAQGAVGGRRVRAGRGGRSGADCDAEGWEGRVGARVPGCGLAGTGAV